MALSILASRDRMSLDNGFDLRLLSALEVLQARQESLELTGDGRERALCSNACLLARALERTEDRLPVFPDGRAVLAGLTTAEIASLAARWSDFSRESDPGPELTQEELEKFKEGLRGDSGERLRWRVLKKFSALPTEKRVRAMKNRDYLWCLTNTILDREEELERLCPECRARAMEEHCALCGRPVREWGEGMKNTSFDSARFEALKEEGGLD